MILLLLLCVAKLHSQVELFPERPKGMLSTGMSFQAWRWERAEGNNQYIDPLNQMAFPITLMVPLTRKMNLTINHIPALSWWYDNRKLNGLSDTWIQASGLFWKDQMVWNVGLGAPTGRTKLGDIEFDLSRQLSRPLFRYKLPVYGQGFCTRLGWAIAIPLREELVFGAGLQYLYRAAYNPVEFTYEIDNETKVVSNKYDPGDEIDLHLGFDVLINEDTKMMIDGSLIRYSADQSDDKKVYEAGNRFYINLGYFHRFRDRYMWAQLRFRKKGKNALWQGVSQKGNEITEGNQVEFDSITEALRFDNSGILFLAEGRFYGKNDTGTNGANIVGFGIGTYMDFWETSRFHLNFKYLVGTLHDQIDRKTDGLEIFTGVDLAF